MFSGKKDTPEKEYKKLSGGPSSSDNKMEDSERPRSSVFSSGSGSSWDCWFCYSTPGPTPGTETVVVHTGQTTYCCCCPTNCCSSSADAHRGGFQDTLSSPSSHASSSAGCDICCCLDCNNCDCSCDCDCSGCDLGGC